MDSQLLDSINIKTYPELIVNFLKDNNINSNFNNLRGFYNELLASLSEDIRDSYLNRILKYLSAKEESNIYILDDIGNEIYEKELMDFFNRVHSEINKSKNSLLFYKKLCGLCSFVYFNNNESAIIKNEFDKSNYSAMLYKLFVHAAINYKTNTPKINNIDVIKPLVLNAPFSLTKLKIDIKACGKLETIPAKINIEIPFPTPFVVILSPTHISNDVPATNERITTNAVNTPFSTNKPDVLYEK